MSLLSLMSFCIDMNPPQKIPTEEVLRRATCNTRHCDSVSEIDLFKKGFVSLQNCGRCSASSACMVQFYLLILALTCEGFCVKLVAMRATP